MAFFQLNIKLIHGKPYHPQTNGKVERFWKIIGQECIFHVQFGQTFSTLTDELNSFLYRYNYERRHGALNYTTPLDRLRLVTETLK